MYYPYYRIINETVRDRLGGLHSAKIILYSVEFDEIEKLQPGNEWDKAGKILGKAAQALESAGADFIVICTNTMHKAAQVLWDAADFCNGVMCIPNLFSLIIFAGLIAKDTKKFIDPMK